MRWIGGWWLVVLLLSSGCTTTSLRGYDQRVLFHSGEVQVPLGQTLRLTYNIATGDGSSSQVLGGGQSLVLGDAVFVGPEVLRNRFRLTRHYLGLGVVRLPDDGRLSLDFGVGLGAVDLLFRAAAAGVGSDKDRHRDLGLLPRLTIGWRLMPWLSIEGRTAQMLPVTIVAAPAYGEIEVAMVLHPGSRVALSGSYRQVRYRSSEVIFGLINEQFKIRMSGPSLQLKLDF